MATTKEKNLISKIIKAQNEVLPNLVAPFQEDPHLPSDEEESPKPSARWKQIVKKKREEDLQEGPLNEAAGGFPEKRMQFSETDKKEWEDWLSTVKAATASEIQLDGTEKKIFDFLTQVNQTVGTEMRVAGGWVRDKLLGIPSDDIDISLRGITGAQFVKAIQDYVKNNPEAARFVGKTYLVEQDIEKSKHLETAGIDLFGLKIDLVNLRSEQYAEESRVPEAKMGTPKEDASRRDLTINSMFYNIGTGQIEDYAGGREDLENMVLRTPLEPKQTFMDDPLRMMRALRFHSRYPNSTVDPSIVEAIADPEVQEAYRTKVSPERAGKEMVKLMEGENPAPAIKLLFESDLYLSVFDIPQLEGYQNIRMDQKNENHKHDLANHIVNVVNNLNQMMLDQGEDKKIRGLMNMSAMFHDFGKMHPEIQQPHPKKKEQMRYLGHEDKSAEVSDAALKHIGIGKGDRTFVNTIVQRHMEPHGAANWNNKSIGKFLNRFGEQQDLWKYVFYHSMADSMSRGTGPEVYQEDIDTKREYITKIEDWMAQQQESGQSVTKPIIDGNVVMEIIPEINPQTGFIKDVTNAILEAQYAGEITTEEQARQRVLEMKPEILQTYQREARMRWTEEDEEEWKKWISLYQKQR